MEKILIDTDVIIDFLRGHGTRIKNIFSEIENKKIHAYLSTVTIVELYAGLSMEIDGGNILEALLSFFEIIPLEERLSRKAGELKRKYQMGLADAVIAASATELEAKLFTFNSRHFKKVTALKLHSFEPSS